MDRNNKKIFLKIYKRIMANTNAIWQHPTHTTNRHLLAAKQQPSQKVYLFLKNTEEIFCKTKKIRRMGH